MKYNFDEIVERKGTDSVKWDLSKDPDVLPMWVADMDFKTAPEITETLLKKISQGLFGYSTIPAGFYDAIIDWWKESHEFSIEKEWLLPAPGMIPTLSAIVRTFVKPGEKIILQPPVYDHFFITLKNCGYLPAINNLKYENGNYQIDFDDLEIKASDPKTTLLMLCNPHNPVGRVWEREELEKIAEICSRHQVMVGSDEIHADLVHDGFRHIPFNSVAVNYDLVAFTCGSPCKTFNLSGMPISYAVSHRREALKQLRKTLEIQETHYPHPIAAEALIAAYTKGRNWMEELKDYLWQNYQYLKDFCNENLPEIKVTPLQATYLVWLDCSALNKTSKELAKKLLEEEKLWVNPGTMYGEAGEGFLRINIACPRALLSEGLGRLKKGLE